MRSIAAIILLGITILCGLLALAAIAFGVWAGKLTSALEFENRPVAFLAVCAGGVLYGIGMLAFGVRTAADLCRTAGPGASDGHPPGLAPPPPPNEPGADETP
jgi:hypothetical protein